MKNISEYLVSIEDGFVNLLHELSKFEKKFNILLPSLNNEIKRYIRQ